MRFGGCLVVMLGALAARTSAGELPVYPTGSGPAMYTSSCTTCGGGWNGTHGMGAKRSAMTGRNTQGGCGSCATAAGQCDNGGGGRDRLQKLIDFLRYRPTPGCDCCPRATAYVPPLHAWFPPVCHANGAYGCASGCGNCGWKKQGKMGCATCGGVAGAPVRAATGNSAAVALKKPVPALPSRPNQFNPPAAMAGGPRPFTPPGQPESKPASPYNAQPATFTPPAELPSGRYQIQPSSYLPPLPKR